MAIDTLEDTQPIEKLSITPSRTELPQVDEYRGKTFKTSNSEYSITKEGTFSGNQELEGADVVQVVGLDGLAEVISYNAKVRNLTKLGSLILDYGQEIGHGKKVFFWLKKGSKDEFFITFPLEQILLILQ